jgi:Uma2 family endonuclease
MTLEELMTYEPPEPYRSELIRGRLVLREPTKLRHGLVAGRVAYAINIWLHNDQIARGATTPRGTVIIGDAGYTLERRPDTVRAPDVAYVAAERLVGVDDDTFAPLAPDLVIEVWSPGNRGPAVLSKVQQFLRAGTPLVWVIHPRRRTAHVYRSDGSEQLLGDGASLFGESVLPEFTLPLATLFG